MYTMLSQELHSHTSRQEIGTAMFTSSSEMKMRKQEARKLARTARHQIWHEMQRNDRLSPNLMAQRFINEFKLSENDVVALTLSIGDELDLLPLMQALSDQRIPMALPRVTSINAALSFRAYRISDRLDFELFGTRAPLATAKEVYPTVMIVPMLAFNREGYRLGYGGGFYDRSIDSLKRNKHQFITVGMAYSAQECEELPTEAHDAKLDYILTEKEFIKIRDC